jgi:hypothetical protein
LLAIGRDAILGVALRHIQRRLDPVKAQPDQRAIDQAVARAVELVAQQQEQDEQPQPFSDLLD